MVSALSDVPKLVLGPLADRADDDWYRAPAGKWTPAQIVHHLALGIDHSGRTLESRRDRPPMGRRPRTLWQLSAYWFIMTVGWSPPRNAPQATLPAVHPDAKVVAQQFHAAVER